MAFQIDNSSFLYSSFKRAENQKIFSTQIIDEKTSKIATRTMLESPSIKTSSNNSSSTWYVPDPIEGKKYLAHSPSSLPITSSLNQLLKNKPPLPPTRSTSLSKNQERSTVMTNSNQIKKPDIGATCITPPVNCANSSQPYKKTPLPTENKSTSLKNAQSGIDLNTILLKKAALKPLINSNQSFNKISKEDNSKVLSITPSSLRFTSADSVKHKIESPRQSNHKNQISFTAKKIEGPKIPSDFVVPKSILKKTIQTARNLESIQETSSSELDETNTSLLSSSNAFEELLPNFEIDQLNELLKDLGIDPIK
jgi:hypothetical protein